MIRQLVFFSLLLLCTHASFAQLDSLALPVNDTTYWRNSFSGGANVNQASFSDNWKSGGENSIALGLFMNGKFNYLKDKISWDNEIQLKYGLLKNAGQDFRKSQDLIYLDSKYGYKISTNWNGFLSGNFITQFAPGYAYADEEGEEDVLISNWMAPAYLTFALGFEYKPEPWFSLRLSPFAPKFTFLNNDEVGLVERYGVPEGDNLRTEWLAAMVQAELDKDIATNLNLKVTYIGYANYETLSFKTLDHRLNTTLTAKVNRFISMTLTGGLLYDYDQDPGVQFSQGLALGVLFNVQNFTEK